MHIAYVCADRGVPIGGMKGASIHVRGVVNALDGQGHDTTVLAANVAQPLAGERTRTVDFGYDRTLKEIKKRIRSSGDTALARETHSLLLNGGLAQQLAALDERKVISAVYERYSLFSYAAQDYALSKGIPFGLEVNAPLVEEHSHYRKLDLAPVATAIEKLVIQRSDVVFVPSDELRGWIESDCGRTRRTVVVPNGVDTELFARGGMHEVPRADALRDRFVIVFTGSLKPWHGIHHLLSVFSKLRRLVPSAHLLVLGDGPLRGVIEETAERIGNEHVTLTGNVPHEQVPAWLARADVAVAPYPALENFYFSPLKVVEYQAAGLPVVASRIGHVQRQIDDGETGLLTAPGDDDELVGALLRLFNEPSLRRELGAKARRWALDTASWSQVARRVARALDRCPESDRPTPADAKEAR